MPLVDPQHGIFDDAKTVLEDYDWKENFRITTGAASKSVVPKVFIHYELAGKRIPDNSIVIQPGIIRGIEAGGPRARISITCNCFSSSPEIAFKLTEAIWNAFMASSDSNNTRWFNSGQFVTAKKFPPVSTSTFGGLQKQANGFWMAIIGLEAETQQSNTN